MIWRINEMETIIFYLVLIALVLVIFGMVFFLIYMKGKENNKSNGKQVIQKFEPDNMAPPLTDMINYHRKNGIVRYDVGE